MSLRHRLNPLWKFDLCIFIHLTSYNLGREKKSHTNGGVGILRTDFSRHQTTLCQLILQPSKFRNPNCGDSAPAPVSLIAALLARADKLSHETSPRQPG